VEHSTEVFDKVKTEAALSAGIFHIDEVPIKAVKGYMKEQGIVTR